MAVGQQGSDGVPTEVRRSGRPPDHSRDAAILALTLDALAEQGYEHLTLDALALAAGRAKTTLYRRWPTKVDLVLAAVAAAGRPPELTRLPDEGSLRADLLVVVDSPWLGGPERRAAVVVGLSSAARASVQLAEAVRRGITEPHVAVYEGLLHRAVDRGELSPTVRARVPLLAQVVPALSSHRQEDGRQPAERGFVVAIVDEVLLPALTG